MDDLVPYECREESESPIGFETTRLGLVTLLKPGDTALLILLYCIARLKRLFIEGIITSHSEVKASWTTHLVISLSAVTTCVEVGCVAAVVVDVFVLSLTLTSPTEQKTNLHKHSVAL